MVKIDSLYTLFKHSDHKALSFLTEIENQFSQNAEIKTQEGLKRGPLFTHLKTEKKNTQPVSAHPAAHRLAQLSLNPAAFQQSELGLKICQPLAALPIKTAHKKLITAFHEGAESALLHLDPSGKTGLPIQNKQDLLSLLDGIDLNSVSLSFSPSPFTARFYMAILFAVLKQKQSDLNTCRVYGGFSPIDDRSQTGVSTFLKQDLSWLADYVKLINTDKLPLHALTINAGLVQNSGGTATEEIAYALSSLACYVRAFQRAGISAQQLMSHIEFKFAITQDIDLTLAKLRAGRACLSAVFSHCGIAVDQQRIYQTAQMSKSVFTIEDSETNLVRMTLAGLAGLLGGADQLILCPPDTLSAPPNEFSERLSRNLQLLLHWESGLNKAKNPVEGSYFYEALTETLSENAWQIFQKCEKQGGFEDVSVFNSFCQRINKQKQQLKTDYAHRQKTLIGVNLYAYDKTNTTALKQKTSSPVLQSDTTEKSDASTCLSALNAAGLIKQVEQGLNLPHSDTPLINSEKLSPIRYATLFESLKKRGKSLYTSDQSAFLMPVILLDSVTHARNRTQFIQDIYKIAGLETRLYALFELDSLLSEAYFQKTGVLAISGTDQAYQTLLQNRFNQIKKLSALKLISVSNGPKPSLIPELSSSKIQILSPDSNIIAELDLILKTLGV